MNKNIAIRYDFIRREMKIQKINFKILSNRTGINYRTLNNQFVKQLDLSISDLLKICMVLNLDIEDVIRIDDI